MNKRLRFSQDLVPLITSGEKTSTWRLWDDKVLTEGDIVDFTTFKTNEYIATAKLTKITEKEFGELTEQDRKGHEKFVSNEQMYQTYSQYYNRPVDQNTRVKIIWFELIK